MQFTTKIPIQPGNKLINYESKVVLLGSCFAESMGEKFEYFKFQNIINPFGILFHSLAIKNLVSRALTDSFYTQEDLVFNNEQWHCLDAHSQLSNRNPHDLLKRLNTELENTKSFLTNATHIIITLGTAWVYQHQNTGSIVANCHKIPANSFTKKLLTVDTVTASLQNLIETVRHVNKEVHFILTVSPVRHLKDGFTQNTVSKSVLIQAVNNVSETLNYVDYFPSYEIIMDELRDYRFYKRDMIHPNQVAIDYIWEQLSASWIHTEAMNLMNRIDKVQKSLQHRPFNENSQAYTVFLAQLQKEQNVIRQLFNHIAF